MSHPRWMLPLLAASACTPDPVDAGPAEPSAAVASLRIAPGGALLTPDAPSQRLAVEARDESGAPVAAAGPARTRPRSRSTRTGR